MTQCEYLKWFWFWQVTPQLLFSNLSSIIASHQLFWQEVIYPMLDEVRRTGQPFDPMRLEVGCLQVKVFSVRVKTFTAFFFFFPLKQFHKLNTTNTTLMVNKESRVCKLLYHNKNKMSSRVKHVQREWRPDENSSCVDGNFLHDDCVFPLCSQFPQRFPSYLQYCWEEENNLEFSRRQMESSTHFLTYVQVCQVWGLMCMAC